MHAGLADYRRQDEELDELSASVERIGGIGLTIHDELVAQVRKTITLKKGVSAASFC